MGLNWTSIDSNSSLESIFQLTIFTQTIEKVKTHRDLERYTCGLGTWGSSCRRSIWAPPKGGEAATITCIWYVGENHVCRFYDTEKREGAKEKDSIYIQRIVEENFDALLPIATLSHLPPPDMQLYTPNDSERKFVHRFVGF